MIQIMYKYQINIYVPHLEINPYNSEIQTMMKLDWNSKRLISNS